MTAQPRSNHTLADSGPQSHAKPIRPAWLAADRCTVRCDDYMVHRGYHRRWADPTGSGWRCFACYPIGDRP